MAVSQPAAVAKLNNPDHSLMHRQIATDPAAAVKAIVVDASNNTLIGDGGTTNYAKISSTGDLSFEGSAGLISPHMMQADTTDQAIENVSLAQLITFNQDVHHSGITRTSNSRFTIIKSGSYLIAFSGIALGLISDSIEVWLRVDDSDIPNSNTRYIFKGNNVVTVIAVTFIEHFTAGQYFEFWTWGSATTSKWEYTAAGTNPTRPATPSIIMTCNYIGKD